MLMANEWFSATNAISSSYLFADFVLIIDVLRCTVRK